MDDSEERAFNIVYYSNLLHELRHFFDFFLTPYGAFAIRDAFINYQLVLGLVFRGAPIVVPFLLGSDPFVVKHELGLSGDEAERIVTSGRLVRNQQRIFDEDGVPFPYPNGKVAHLGGSAMLEALAFNFQSTFLNFPTLRTPALERMFPDAFREFNGNDPSDVDVVYKWFAPLQRLIGTDQNTGVAKLLHVIIFASLCGTYRSGTQTNLRRAFDKISDVPVFSLGPQLPSRLFQNLLRSAIDRFDGQRVDENLSWDNAWDTVDGLLEQECGRGMLASMRLTLSKMRSLRTP